MKKRISLVSTSIVAAFFISGCSVKPEPLPKNFVEKDAKISLNKIEQIQKPIIKPLSLEDAIKRAIKHNLGRKLDILTSAMEKQKIDIAAYEALPDLTAQAGYAKRDNYAASQSVTFIDGVPGKKTDSYSVSQDKESANTSIGFSWNILDFGLSYVRANQQANKYLIAKEKERKSIHNIQQEVRNVYYQAVSADELLNRIKPIMEQTKKALEDSTNISKQKLESPLKALTYQRELLEVIRALNTLEENLVKSKIELARLMGLKPGTKFQLEEKIKEKYELPQINMEIKKLEKIALENRPELQESRYQEKISQDEIKSVMLNMLPGINLNTSYNFNDSEYLLNNEWTAYGANISWNLMNVFNAPLKHKLVKTQQELAKEQKIAMAMAVISQVHLSVLEFHQAKKDYELSENYYSVAKDIFNIIEGENALDVNGKLSLIKEKLNYLIASLRLSSSYAKVQNSYGKIIASVGKTDAFNNQKIEKKEELKIEEKVVQKIKKVEEPNKRIMAIANEDSNIRKEPSLNSQINAILLKEEQVEVINKVLTEHGYWYETPKGYISSDLLNTKSNNNW